jgi:hypothetical protein
MQFLLAQLSISLTYVKRSQIYQIGEFRRDRSVDTIVSLRRIERG